MSLALSPGRYTIPAMRDTTLPTTRFTEDQLREKYERLRLKLGLEGTIWWEIDPDLLLLAFIHRSATNQIPEETLDRMEDKYMATDYEWHEFLGDGVLKMLGTTLVTELSSLEYLSQAHTFRQELDRNTTLYCYMNQKGLCSEIIKDPLTQYGYKMCADMLEAVFGVLYWWGYYVLGLGYGVLQHVRDWYVRTWPIRESLDQLFDTGRVRCGLSETGHGPFTEWTPCDPSGVTLEQYRTAPCLDPMNCTGPLNETRPCPRIVIPTPSTRPPRRNLAPTPRTPVVRAPTMTNQPNRIVDRVELNRMAIPERRRQLDYEIGILLQSPLVKGVDRDYLLRTRPTLTTAIGSYLGTVKSRIDQIASTIGVST